jgi:hypothetical protein
MTSQRERVLWPNRENYARFRSVCDDAVQATFEEFEAIANPRLRQMEVRHDIVIEKIAFDPDRMAQWCRVNFGKVDSDSRRHYAIFIATSN